MGGRTFRIIGSLGFGLPGGWSGQSWSTLTFVALRRCSVEAEGGPGPSNGRLIGKINLLPLFTSLLCTSEYEAPSSCLWFNGGSHVTESHKLSLLIRHFVVQLKKGLAPDSKKQQPVILQV